MARRRKTQLELPVAVETPATGAQVASDAPTEGPSTQVTQPQRWRVVRTTQVSLFGQLTTVQAGDVISAAGYGSRGMKRLAEQVELVPVE